MFILKIIIKTNVHKNIEKRGKYNMLDEKNNCEVNNI